jgi:hypothetical protein
MSTLSERPLRRSADAQRRFIAGLAQQSGLSVQDLLRHGAGGKHPDPRLALLATLLERIELRSEAACATIDEVLAHIDASHRRMAAATCRQRGA